MTKINYPHFQLDTAYLRFFPKLGYALAFDNIFHSEEARKKERGASVGSLDFNVAWERFRKNSGFLLFSEGM